MTQQSILHLVVNWEVLRKYLLFYCRNFISNLHLHIFDLLIKVDLRSGGQIYTTMQYFVKIGRMRDITFFSIFKMAAVGNVGFSNFEIYGRGSD